MDKAKVIDKLNEILRWEWTGLAQYAQHSFMVSGVWREVYAEMFSESAEECFGHAKKIADKIVALGGVPDITREEVQQTNDLTEMLEIGLGFEQQAVDLYAVALEMVDDDPPLRVLLEDIILEEQEGVDHINKLLRGQSSAGGQGSKAAAG